MGKIQILVNAVLSVAIAFSSFAPFDAAHAAPSSEYSQLDARVKANDARLDELEKHTWVISPAVAKEIDESITESITIMNDIMVSDLTDDEKGELLASVTRFFGNTIFKVMRHHGFDSRLVDDEINNRERPTGIGEIAQYYLAKTGRNMQLAVREMMFDLLVLTNSGPIKEAGWVWFQSPRDRYGKKIWKPLEMKTREKLVLELLAKLQPATIEGLKNLEKGEGTTAQNRFLGNLVYLVDRGLKIRKVRDDAQNAALLSWLGIQAFMVMNPINIGEHTYTSSIESAVVMLGLFSVPPLIKRMTMSSRSTRAFESYQDLLKGIPYIDRVHIFINDQKQEKLAKKIAEAKAKGKNCDDLLAQLKEAKAAAGKPRGNGW